MTIEYRVKRVERFIVTRYEAPTSSDGATTEVSVRQIGKEFDSFETAYEVGYSLAKEDQRRLGLPEDDMGVIFPSSSLEDARFARDGLALETYRSSNPRIGG